ncbi:MAG TPA: outer membrane lipid asymmetry maintenance protein MlaD [Dongiaceae bacterium]|jgi:phospholipid/cholesterol/gamma-HCH transport system substrate-binding protein|nr:outer membrane lipid asymmetry maintenance protein MlaD [Dongiaceae bacterium]
MKRNILETLVGAAVLLAALVFLVVIYRGGGVTRTTGYPLTLRFDHADGLVPGTDVRLGGIKIGSVASQHLDRRTYQAIITISVDPTLQLPKDTSAKITSDGLLGNNYLSLSPGAEDQMLAPGEEITHTQSAINVLDLIAKYAFGTGQQKPQQ